MKKRIFSALLISALAVSALTACGGSSSAKKSGQTLTVLNYGKYIDESVVKQFEKETGITVKYEEYESPEEMYTKYKAGSINYDVICSSEYMVERLINEGEVLEEDYDAMDNYKNLDPTILDMSASYDKNHTYSVPYFYGTLGLLYNKTTIDAKTVSSWNCLWDPTYEDEIIMENSVRDTFAPALISKGYSLNDTDENSYHDIAAHKFFPGEEIELICCSTFEEVFANIKQDSNVIGMLAIENTIAGSLLHNYELLRESGMTIVGEHKLRIKHSFMCLPDDNWETLTEVNSHPVALAQCREFLIQHPKLKIVETEDTAGSAEAIKRENLKGHAAICSRYAADLYGMKVLEEGIETNKHNFTRFLVVADPWKADEPDAGNS